MRGVFSGLVTLVALIVLLGSPAHADVRDEAAREFARGEAADRRRDYERALKHYLRANELVPHPNAMFNIATNYERLGNASEAVIWYQRYLDESHDPPDRDVVLRKIRELENRRVPGFDESAPVVTGTLRVIGPIGAMVFIDDESAGPVPVVTDLPPGPHTVRVTQDGFQAYESKIEIQPRRTSIVRATMTRALGKVPTRTIRAGYLFGVAGGLDVREQGPAFLVDLGIQALKYDFAVRAGKVNSRTTVDVVVRAALGSGRLAPYLGGGYSFAGSGSDSDGASSGTNLGGGYTLIGGLRYQMSRGEHSMVALVAESGLRIISANGGSSSSDGTVMIPVMASVQLIYK